MSDLFEDPTEGPGDNAPEFTVSELSGAVKKTIESGFSRVRVRGEIGRVSRPRSGHIYMDLKDDRSVLAGVIWKGVAGRLVTQPEEGLEVVATGKLTTFPGQSKYQIVIDDIAPAGVGALMALLEKRKKMLEAEGLFSADRKRPLPYLPEVIGVVTSPSGAVIRDILHRLRDRFPRKVLIWPVAVQGERCAPEVTAAIEGFNRLSPGGALPRPDLLIVARGGGSIEDLWGFNEETVVRAAVASEIPLISAVGHETDTTLIDFVSDKRAPTPTAAAELAVPVRSELLAWTTEQGSRLTSALLRGVQRSGERLRDLSRALPRPEDLTRPSAQRLDMWSDRLPRALSAGIERRKLRLSRSSGVMRPSLLEARLNTDRTRLQRASGRLDGALTAAIARQRLLLERRSAGLSLTGIATANQQRSRALGDTARRARLAVTGLIREGSNRLEALDRLRTGLGHVETLKRGFAIVRADGALATTIAAVKAAETLEIELQDGRFETKAKGASKTRSPKARTAGPGQGTLFED